jgi:hypothetical protein
MLSAAHDVERLLVLLIADRLRIIPGGRDQEEQRLHPRVAGALGHDVKELPVRLRVQLIEDNAVGIEAVLVCHIGGQHLVEAVRRQVFEPLLRFEYLHALAECRAEPHHIDCHVKDDLGLIAVSGAAVGPRRVPRRRRR